MFIAAADNPMVFQFMFEDALAALNTFASTGSASMSTIAAAAGYPMMGIYILLWGLSIISGNSQEPALDGAKRVTKAVVILTFATSAGIYNEWVINFFTQVPGAIAAEVAQSGSSQAYTMTDTAATAQMLDAALGSGLKAGANAWQTSAGLDISASFGYSLIAILIWAFVACVCAYGGALVLCANMGLSIMLALGPIFIIMAMFEATSSLFQAWTRQLITFAVFFIVIACAISLTFAFFTPFIQSLAAYKGEAGVSVVVVQFIKLICFCAASLLVLIQSVSWASGLAGGVAVAADGHLRAMMGGAISKVGGAPGAAMSAPGKALDWGMRQERRAKFASRGASKAAAYLRSNKVSRN